MLLIASFEMPPRRQNHCYAPGCQTGYVHVKGATKPSLFIAPKDLELRKKWQKNLHRADKPLEDTSAVCELHFEPGCIVRQYVHTVNGEEVRIERGKPALRSDAVPTILPNLPAYLTKKTVNERAPRKRKAENSGTPAKRMLRAGREGDVSAPATDTDAATAVAEQGSEAGRQESTGVQNPVEASDDASVFDCLVLPSARWSKHSFPGHGGVVYCTSVLSSKSEVHSEKVVIFFDSPSKTYCKVFARGILIKESAVETKQVAEEVLQAADSMCLCTGAIKCQEYDGALFTQKLKAHAIAHEDVYFSSNCLGQVAKTGIYHSGA